ncbi:unnamed protein product [Dicrocoelium dendriticum]|nr:unnamed protein product [Dicrocoelium dendriticum]
MPRMNDGSLFYLEAAYLVCLVMGKTTRLKSALYGNHFKTDLRKLYALASKSLQSGALLNAVIDHCGLLEKENPAHLIVHNISNDSYGCKRCFLVVLSYDLLMGCQHSAYDLVSLELTKITGDRTTAQKLRQSYEAICKQNPQNLTTTATGFSLPCYARVNQLCASLDCVLQELSTHGFKQLLYNRENISYRRFLKKVKKLEGNQFMLDYHLPHVLLVFPPGLCLHKLPPSVSGNLIIQDKASCIATEVLRPLAGADVLDACAAPGNKTLHLVAAMSPDSTLFAVDWDPTRFRLLCEHLSASGVQYLITSGPLNSSSIHLESSTENTRTQPTVEALCEDFLSLNPHDPKFSRVKYILLDPSCSGTGLYGRQPDVTRPLNSPTTDQSRRYDLVDEHEAERLQRLSNLQAKLLRHALSFPNLERVVYSTCSIHSEENETVVSESVEREAGKFQLERIWMDPPSESGGCNKPFWPHRGFSDFGCEPCIRASPEEDLTNGFFIASFKRVFQSDLSESAETKTKRRNSQDSIDGVCMKKPKIAT